MNSILNKFKRTNFYKIQTINGIIENDLVTNKFDSFIITRPVKYYTLSRADIQRPDLLSLKIYGDLQYWWILLKVNNIDDVWNDMTPEKIIIVPDLEDIDDWLIKINS